MKQNRSLQQWLSAAVVGLVLTGAPSLGLAANLTYPFDSDAQGWSGGNAASTVVWDNTHNRGASGGCLKATLTVATGNTLCVAYDTTVDTSKYFGVEFDLMVDAASGTDSGSAYGELQVGYFDAGWAWQSTWYGTLGGATGQFATWKHVVLPFQSPYGVKEHLQILLQAPGGGTFNGDVTVYIDNILIQDGTPGSQVALYDFAWPDEITSANAWGGTWSHDTTLKPDGALKIVKDYGAGVSSWQDTAAEFKTYERNTVDFSKFTYIDFDVYLDAPKGQYAYGNIQLHPWWGWSGLASANLSEANIGKWTHYSFPINVTTDHGLVFHPGGGNLSNVFTYYIDNVTVWKSPEPPKVTQIRFEPTPTVAGAEITMNAKNNQYQRDAICVPSGAVDYSWVNRCPISYSFGIANFPDAAAHPGFEAHLFLVNESTIPDAGSRTWNETYGGCDWNAADLLKFTIENRAAGGTIVRLSWKTNTPGANPPTGNMLVDTNGPTAVGSWALNFDSNTTGTITGPEGFSVSFTLPADLVTQFDPNGAAVLSFLQLGAGQNDGSNQNRNYNCSVVFNSLAISGGLYPFSDTFPGPALNSSGINWRSTGNAVQWTPAGVGAWVSWTTPDDGFSLQAAPNLNNWSDAQVQSTFSIGNVKSGSVPAANVPSGTGFFRLMKP